MKALTKKNTIKRKVFLYICTMSVLSLAGTSIFVYILFYRTLTENEIEFTVKSSNEAKSKIEFFLKEIDNTATLLGANKDILNELNRPYMPFETADRETENKISTMLKNIISVQEYIKGIYILGRSTGSFYTSDWGVNEDQVREMYRLKANQNVSADQYYTGVHRINYHMYSDSKVITFVRPIIIFPSERYMGTLIIDLNYDYLREMFAISTSQNDEKVLVVTPDGDTIFNFPFLTILDDVIQKNPELLRLPNAKLYRKVFGKQSIIVSDTIDYSDWKIIRVVSTDKIYE